MGTVHQYPALNTQGISHARLDFGVGGVIPPHFHPLATETLFVVQGSIYTGFISYDNVLYAEVLQQGDLYIFPRATVHFQINVGTGPAVTFNSLNSQYPGFLITANQLLETKISSAVLEASLGINAQELASLQAALPSFWSQAAPWFNLRGSHWGTTLDCRLPTSNSWEPIPGNQFLGTHLKRIESLSWTLPWTLASI